jgi:hypothetical protein
VRAAATSFFRRAEFHEPWKAGLLRSLLEKENVPCIVRGYYHRSLLYLFGPYIEMPVFVRGSNQKVAMDVMGKYFANRSVEDPRVLPGRTRAQITDGAQGNERP